MSLGNRLVSVGNHYGAHIPFMDLFAETIFVDRSNFTNTSLNESDVVLFGGGEDISPSLYNQSPNRYTHALDVPSSRDRIEQHMFNVAVKANAKMLGICRGAQLVCALSGGSLVQHVTHHAGNDHTMTTKDGRNIIVCSVHHQMMNPFATEHELIGWAKDNLSSCYLVEKDKNIEIPCEPEVVWFPATQALGIQYHPEFMSDKDEAVIYSRELVCKYLLGESNV